MKTFKILWFGLLITFFVVMGALVGFTKWTMFVTSLLVVSYLSTIWKKRKEILRLMWLGLKWRNKYFWGFVKIAVVYVIAISTVAFFAPKNPVIEFVIFYCYAFIVIMTLAYLYDRGKMFEKYKSKSNDNELS